MTGPDDPTQATAEDTADPREPEPSAPTSFLGAPHIGLDWFDPTARPAAWRAFGEDA
ncbi:hypothetical protein ACIRVF_08170 [Kitasatospora sp. NPDC101157]|uniref:hypothetical protein n=1 Tax=Kitasatospora sp. NPDC101157 TaxID=3364098 RepID=UPI00382E4743